MKLRIFYLTLLVCVIFSLGASASAFGKDTWINVRTKNFFLVGNASEKDIRLTATKLEQFRETFRLLFPNAKFNQTIQTNVVVFKSDADYRPFKPKRADGKPEDWVGGYFQPGEDVNYITVAASQREDNFNIIFHEYVHFLLNTNFGKGEIPPWFNEGLAEYYATFKIADDQKVTLGDLQPQHLDLLQRNPLMPLKDFFELNNYSLHQNGNHSRSIFYAQAWALMHYLIQGNNGANKGAMSSFLSLVMNGAEPETAFQKAFGFDYATMEKALKAYVSQSKFMTTVATFKNKLVFDTQMTTLPLTEADANAYLGDLLYHTHRIEDAEIYLQKAVALDAENSLANTAFGLVRMRQRNFTEAKKYLEKAINANRQNHFAYYNYALILSRESMDEFGFVAKFPPEAARKMREALQRAIEINPNFIESYRLLSFVNLVNNENLEESLAFLKKVMELQPGNQESAYLIAQLYMRQEKFAEARELAEKIYKTSDDADLRNKAQQLLNDLKQYEESRAFNEKQAKEMEEQGIRAPVFVRKKDKTEAEIAKIEEENQINNLNRIIAKPKAGEKQAVGSIEKVACLKGEVFYTVKTDTESFQLSSKDFSALELSAMIEEAQSMEFGCDAQVSNLRAVLTYRPAADAKAKTRGNLLAIAFVPKFFRLKTQEELNQAREIVLVEDETEQTPEEKAEMEKNRRAMMLDGIKQSLRTPLAGETRALGIIEKIECSGNSIIFITRIGAQTIKLKAKSPQDVKMMSFTSEVAGMQFGCGVKPPPITAVITYRPKDKDGEMVSIEYVPKSFTLE
jgi:tetratricopeptide (TPR) repeat protein